MTAVPLPNLSIGRDMQDGADGQTHFCVTLA